VITENMEQHLFLYSFLAVLLAILATFIWRFLGVVIASRIPADSPMMGWINAIAYSMVSGVLMLIVVYPSGVLSTTSLDQRLFGLFVGLVVVSLFKRLILALCCGVFAFALAVSFF